MALKRLPNDVQSLLCASAQVNSYKRAIEELIYNSLDAKSTSIAIRLHIQENTIQLIDNGFGISKQDFNSIGLRHMTSKLIDVATLKAAPKNYGYRGDFLSNIITVSQMVKITSRHESTEETWAKTFYNGKEKRLVQMATRPTKGTTVDIKGFLHNLNIQKRGIDSINELQDIKSFLEQLSLVQNHVSLSLRDDSQNKIVFKIHKKRDIYQTLKILFNIEKQDVQELQVEKREYQVKGYIGKFNKEIDLHWIYINGKFVHSHSKLHKVLNEYFKKSLHIKDQRALKSKKNYDEHRVFNQDIPFYLIFVTCPYFDYDVSHTPKQSVIEFTNWNQMNKLLEKLIKFYAGDINLKELKKVEEKPMNKEQINTKVNQDTRDQVKKIMDKILGNNSKKLGFSQLQNGIKGKIIKRKAKKIKNRSTTIPKLFLKNKKKRTGDDIVAVKSKAELSFEDRIEQHIIQQTEEVSDKNEKYKTPTVPRNHDEKAKIPDLKKYKTNDELKVNMLSLSKKRDKTKKKQKHTFNKKGTNNELKNVKDNTDSVCERSKMVAQKAEDFLRQTRKMNVVIKRLQNPSKKIMKKTMFLRKKYCAIKDNIPLLPKTDKYIIEKYIMNKINAKPYKTTYDLVQTVLKSQQELLDFTGNNLSEELYNTFRKRNELRCVKIPKRYTRTNKYICSEYSNNNGKEERISHTTNIHARYKTYYSDIEENFHKNPNVLEHKEITDIMTNLSERSEFIDKDENILSQSQNICCTQKETSYRPLSDPSRILTYDSHQYHNNNIFIRNDEGERCTSNKKQSVRFITKESRDNFVTSNDFKNRFAKLFKPVSNKQIKTFDIRMKQTIDESYTIEYTKSNENCYNMGHNDIPPNNVYVINDTDYYKHAIVNYEPLSPINDLNPGFGHTYTIQPSNTSYNVNFSIENQMIRMHNIQSPKLTDYSVYFHPPNKTEDEFAHHSKNFNVVFVSKSQRSETLPSNNNFSIEPLNVCETVFNEIGSGEKDFAVSFNENNRLNDSLYYGIDEHVENEQVIRTEANDDISTSVSHHFNCGVKTKDPNQLESVVDIINLQDHMPMEINQNEIVNKVIRTEDASTEGNAYLDNIDCNFENNFNLKNRPRFMPKGMSQIFENCRTKTACSYDFDKDYYEDSIFNNFANDVQVNTEIYEPEIQNVDDLTTKHIHNFQNKVKKDNASLVFDEMSLKEAKVLGQADCKFIVAIMEKRCVQSKKASDYLILFDQHAVHERIRLEKNLADYFKKEGWTTIAVDNIILKMSKDEILYLHNYKNKFIQLGLQWTILNENEVAVLSIPKAILGKNSREVDTVIKAVRNLIIEEINDIKLQKGCVSLYPKSIMDLVFSESCRYAIKFGDQLSKSDCVELLSALSKCKTPFQCAHGRPVMAVIMNIVADKREYKINVEALRRFRQRNT